RHGCTFGTGCCRHMRRRNSRPGRILDCSGSAAAVHRGLVANQQQASWLAGIISAGYMLAVIPLVSLTDRRPARQIYLASSALTSLSCVGRALCDSLLPALGFRALAGIAMAGMYMPGLRALTSVTREELIERLHRRAVTLIDVRPNSSIERGIFQGPSV